MLWNSCSLLWKTLQWLFESPLFYLGSPAQRCTGAHRMFSSARWDWHLWTQWTSCPVHVWMVQCLQGVLDSLYAVRFICAWTEELLPPTACSEAPTLCYYLTRYIRCFSFKALGKRSVLRYQNRYKEIHSIWSETCFPVAIRTNAVGQLQERKKTFALRYKFLWLLEFGVRHSQKSGLLAAFVSKKWWMLEESLD